jgi:hypothetical protein
MSSRPGCLGGGNRPSARIAASATRGSRLLAAALGATVPLLAATFAWVAHTPVDPARLAVFVLGTTALLTAVGAVLAAIVLVRCADRRMLAEALRGRWANVAQGCDPVTAPAG